MKKSNFVFNIILYGSILIILSAAIISFLLLITNNTGAIALFLGILGILGIVLVFIGGFFVNKYISDENSIDENNEYYKSLVSENENNPNKFNKKLKRLLNIGNIYIFLLIVFILTFFFGIVIIGIITNSSMGGFGIVFAGLAGILFILLKSIYIKPESYEKSDITRESYPIIFGLLDEAVKLTNATKIDDVYLSTDCNCSVMSPYIGFGFKNKNILRVGIQLLQILDKDELKSVFIHELAHIYNNDTRISRITYRNIERWSKILASLEKKNDIFPHLMLEGFAHYYIMKMQMYLDAISKQCEYAADREAVKFTDGLTYATALAKIEVMNEYNFDFAENFEIRDLDEPPKNFYNLLYDNFYNVQKRKQKQWIEQIKKKISTPYDTHPSLTERVAAAGINDFNNELDFDNMDPDYKTETDKLVDIQNNIYYSGMKDEWKEYCADYKKNKELINNYTETDDAEKNLDYGMAFEDIGNYDKALEIYNRMIERDNKCTSALYRKGQLLLIKNDNSGIDLVKQAIDNDNIYIENGLNLLYDYLLKNNLDEKRIELKDWANEKIQLKNRMDEELSLIGNDDTFITPDIDKDTRIKLIEIFAAYKSITEVLIAKKKLKYSNTNLNTIIVVFSSFQSVKKNDKCIDEIMKQLDELDLLYNILSLSKHSYIYGKISMVEGSVFYKK